MLDVGGVFFVEGEVIDFLVVEEDGDGLVEYGEVDAFDGGEEFDDEFDGGEVGLLSSTSSGTSVLMETILWTYPSLRKVRR